MPTPITLLDLDAAGMDLSQPAPPELVAFLRENSEDGYVTLWSTLLDEFYGLSLVWDWLNDADELQRPQYRLKSQFVAPPTAVKPSGAGVTEITYGGGAPDWVPAGAKIHIDFLGGTPQGRAWVDGTGEVAIETLLGNDPVVSEVHGAANEYLSSDLMADGYLPSGVPNSYYTCYLGIARSSIMAGATLRYQFKCTAPVTTHTIMFGMSSADGNDALELSIQSSADGLSLSSWNGPVSADLNVAINATTGATNVVAMTVAGMRFEAALNGHSEVIAATLMDADRPAANPLDGVWFGFRGLNSAIQSITIYDPLPTTAGLSELSEIT